MAFLLSVNILIPTHFQHSIDIIFLKLSTLRFWLVLPNPSLLVNDVHGCKTPMMLPSTSQVQHTTSKIPFFNVVCQSQSDQQCRSKSTILIWSTSKMVPLQSLLQQWIRLKNGESGCRSAARLLKAASQTLPRDFYASQHLQLKERPSCLLHSKRAHFLKKHSLTSRQE